MGQHKIDHPVDPTVRFHRLRFAETPTTNTACSRSEAHSWIAGSAGGDDQVWKCTRPGNGGRKLAKPAEQPTNRGCWHSHPSNLEGGVLRLPFSFPPHCTYRAPPEYPGSLPAAVAPGLSSYGFLCRHQQNSTISTRADAQTSTAHSQLHAGTIASRGPCRHLFPRSLLAFSTQTRFR